MTTAASIIFYLIATVFAAQIGVDLEKRNPTAVRVCAACWVVFFGAGATFQIFG